jgi:ParB family chromosome partitioning protein
MDGKTKRRLGRGLDALLGRNFEAELLAESEPPAQPLDPAEFLWIAVDQIEPNPYQPRSCINPTELQPLVESIRQHGILQPVVVRRHGDEFQLIAGERRLRAAELAGMATIPARVIEATDRQLFELAIVENLHRSDLNAIEKARAFKDYMERFGGTYRELAERVGIDETTVVNFVRLLDLPDELQHLIETGQLSPGHARPLLGLKDTAQQLEIAQKIMAEGWSVRKVERVVSSVRKAQDDRPRAGKAALRTAHIDHLEEVLRQKLGTIVLIRLHRRHEGKIVIEFHSSEEFDRIIELICGDAAPSGL